MDFPSPRRTQDSQPTSSSTYDYASLRVRLSLTLGLLVLLFVPVSHFNFSVFYMLNGLNSPVTDRIWLFFTTVGDGLSLGILLGAFVTIDYRIPLLGINLMLVGSVLVHIVKFTMPTLRPAGQLIGVHVVGPLLRHGSFPSGHTSAAFCAAFALCFFIPHRPTRIAALTVASCIALSRIFVGAHFPEDVIGGLMTAATASLMMSYIWPVAARGLPLPEKLEPITLRRLVYIEVIAAVFCATVYAVYFAESAVVGVFVGVSALSFLAFQRYILLPRRSSTRL